MNAGKLTREEVMAAYRLMLSRAPESAQAIEAHVGNSSHEQLLSIILSSEEFQSRLQNIDLRTYPVRAVAADREAPSCMRRLEHIAGLHLPIFGKSVTDVGAGLGFMASYFLDRMCAVRLVDVSPTLLNLARLHFAASEPPDVENLSFQAIDLDGARAGDLERRQVTVCCDMLWQAKDIDWSLRALAEMTDEILLLETRFAFGRRENLFVNADPDPDKMGNVRIASNVYPTRAWLWSKLGELFEHVYATRTQPNHPDFPLDWNSRNGYSSDGFGRGVFVASRRPIQSPWLSSSLESVAIRAD